MSQTEAERFIEDLKSDDAMLESLKSEATSLEGVVSFAKDKGYELDMDDANAFVRDQVEQELNDEELDSIAGGKGSSHSSFSLDSSTISKAISNGLK